MAIVPDKSGNNPNVDEPMSNAIPFPITPSDTVNSRPFRYLAAGADGNIAVVDATGAVTVVPVVGGHQIKCAGVRVNSTDTTTTGIVGFA